MRRRFSPCLPCAVDGVLLEHPWAQLLAPSQLLEIHEVFNGFGEAHHCERTATCDTVDVGSTHKF
eukprot:scaffold49349_cov33-Tisochrysis_lutea.AAC.1